MSLPLFVPGGGDGGLRAQRQLSVQAQGLMGTLVAKATEARHKIWAERLPKDKADLWDALTGLTGDEQAALCTLRLVRCRRAVMGGFGGCQSR